MLLSIQRMPTLRKIFDTANFLTKTRESFIIKDVLISQHEINATGLDFLVGKIYFDNDR